MRIKKVLQVVLSLVIVLCGVLTPLSGYAADSKSSIPYDYPVVPGTPEWNAMATTVEKIEACAVPRELLENMTTAALVETNVTYPLFLNVYAFNTLIEGFRHLALYFDGAEILRGRPDAMDCLQAYIDAHPGDEYTLPVINAEALMQFIPAMKQWESKIANEPYIADTTPYPWKEGEAAPELRSGPGAPIYTPNLTEVPVYVNGSQNRFYDLSYADHGTTYNKAKAISDGYSLIYTSAVQLAPCNPSYNCHSYAWHSQLTTNKYWINDPSVYMVDGSYTLSTAAAGRKVVYISGSLGLDHSGIVYSASTGGVVVESKWGICGLFRHNLSDCPYAVSGTANTYWA